MKYTITERTKEGLRKTSASKQQILEQKKCKEILTSYFISLESEAFTKLAVTNSESHSYITTTFAGVGVEFAMSGSARLQHTRPQGVWTNVWQLQSFQ